MIVFSNPVFLFGAVALAAVLIVHLLVRARCRQVDFTSLGFISKGFENQKYRLRLIDILMMLIRCAAVLFIIAAFAGPMIVSAKDRKAKNTVNIVVVDDSLSASLRLVPGRTVLDEIKAGAVEYINNCGSDERFWVYSFSSGIIAGDLGKEQAAEITGSVKQGLFTADFDVLAEVLRRFDRRDRFVKIFIGSDFSPIVMQALGQVRARLNFDALDVCCIDGAGVTDNSAILRAGAGRIRGGGLSCYAVAANRGKTICERKISVSSGGEVLRSKDVVISPGSETAVYFTLDPEDLILTGDCAALEFALTGEDMIEGDDRYFLGADMSEPAESGILAVTFSRDQGILLEAALNSLGKCEGTRKIMFGKTLISEFSKRSLDRWDSVVFCGIGAEVFQASKKLESFIEAGGSVYFFTSGSDQPSLSRSRDGAGFLPAFMNGLIEAEPGTAPGRADHRIRSLTGNYDLGGVLLNAYHRLDPAAGSEVVWRLNNGEIFVAQKKFGRGKSVIINTSVDNSLSGLSTNRAWPLFCSWLFGLGEDARELVYEPGLVRLAEPGADDLPVEILYPDGRTEKKRLIDGKIGFAAPARTGWIYVSSNDSVPGNNGVGEEAADRTNAKFQRWVGVNPAVRETVLSALRADEIKNNVLALLDYDISKVKTSGVSAQNTNYRNIWKLFIIAAIAAVLLEHILIFFIRCLRSS